MPLKSILMVTVFIGMLVHVIYFWKRKDIPVGMPIRLKREFWQVIVLFAVIFFWESINNYLAFHTETSTRLLAWIKLASVLGLLIIFAFVLDKKKLKELGFRMPSQHYMWMVGILIFLLWAAALWEKSEMVIGAFLLMLFRDVFMEELIFRGYIQTNLERSLGTNRGFWIAVFVFTSYHIPNIFWGWQAHYELGSFPEKIVRLAGVFIMSLFLCSIFKKTRSLYPLFAIHFLANNHLSNLFYLIF
jgi:membrane protease YdiL (CAAX protease family)